MATDIRILEGYWGPSRLSEFLSDLCCWRQFRARDRLAERRRPITESAFEKARTALAKDAGDRRLRGLTPVATSRDLDLIEALLLKQEVEASPDEWISARQVRWQEWAPARWARRLEHLREAERRYPPGNRILPTRLGNVLRSHEAMAFPNPKGGGLAGAVQRVFNRLPADLQAEHDQDRNRLNLYCALVVVVAVVGVVAVIRIWSLGWPYVVGAIAGSAIAALLFYRAAIASAEAYGVMLETIGAWERDHPEGEVGRLP